LPVRLHPYWARERALYITRWRVLLLQPEAEVFIPPSW